MSVPERFDPDPGAERAAVVPLPARRRRGRPAPRRGRSPLRWGGAALLVVLLVGLLGGGLEAWSLKRQADTLQAAVGRQLAAAAGHLQTGKTDVAKASTANDPNLLRQANAEFDLARQDFRAAQQRIDSDPLIREAESLPYARPYVAPRRAAVDNLAQMGLALCDAGEDAAGVDANLITPGNASLSGGARLIAALNAAQPFIGKISADLGRAKVYADRVDAAVIPSSQRGSFLKARTEIDNGLAGAGEFQTLAPVMLELLGANGPRSYLVEDLDPAELRGGGGYIGSYILVSANRGDVQLGASGDVYGIDYPYPVKGQKKYVPPPNSLNEFASHGWVFGDSSFYADFPASARAGEDLFKRETGRSVDGVIGLDFWAVAQLLAVTGPIAVTDYGVTVDAKTFPDEVVHRLLTEAANVPGKKKFFPAVASLVIDKVTKMDSANWSNLLDHLNTAVTQRHMEVYFNNQPAQTEMSNLGWSGRQLAPSSQQELIQEVEANYGGDKANYWLTRSFTLELTVQGGKLQHHLAVSLQNRIPAGFEGGQDYRAYFRFYYPADATDPRAGGLLPDKYASDEKPIGLSLLDGWYQMPPMSDYNKVEFNYTTDAGNLAAGHQIYWEKQPGTLADKVHVIYKVDGKTYTLDTDLTQDRVLVLTGDGIRVSPGEAGSIKLPLLG